MEENSEKGIASLKKDFGKVTALHIRKHTKDCSESIRNVIEKATGSYRKSKKIAKTSREKGFLKSYGQT